MALAAPTFDPPYDIHLLRGQSINLKDLIDANYKTEHSTATYLFNAQFSGVTAGGKLTGHNIELNISTGLLKLDGAAPAVEKRNFVVDVTATVGADTSGPTGIRIHVHQSIAEAWLSPSTLTVYPGLNGSQFSVRARFDDNVVAEIGNIYRGDFGSKVNYGTTLPLSITWAEDVPSSDISINSSGEITATSSGVDKKFAVTATIKNSTLGINVDAKGEISVKKTLAGTDSSIKAELIAVGSPPGYSATQDRVNVLFACDGFVDGEKDVFDATLDDYAHTLYGLTSLPYAWLSDRINLWKVFIPSRENGGTNRCEAMMQRGLRGDKYIPVPIVSRVKLNAVAEVTTYQDLFYRLGMPVEEDSTKSDATIIADWKTLTSVDPIVIDLIASTGSFLEKWKVAGKRVLPEEKDTAMGLLSNDYTSFERDSDYGMMHFSKKRLSRAQFDTFLDHLEDAAGNKVGKLFKTGAPDSNKICFLSGGVNARVQNIGTGFFALVRESVKTFEVTEAGPKVTLVQSNADLNRFDAEVKATITHELSHSFCLGDEYGEHPPDSSFDGLEIDDAKLIGWKYAIYPDSKRSNLDSYGNVQARHDLLIPDPVVAGASMIDPDKIKWRWHRIKKCGFVKSIVKVGSEYKVEILIPPQVLPIMGGPVPFAKDDVVFLRKRKRSEPIATLTRTGSPHPVDTSDTITYRVSGQMNIKTDPVFPAIATDPIQITITGTILPASLTTIAANEEMILYAPTLLAGVPQELVSEDTRALLRANPFPLNANAAHHEIIDKSMTRGIPNTTAAFRTALEAHFNSPKKTALFSGGSLHHGHVYHASLSCIMRTQYRPLKFRTDLEIEDMIIRDFEKTEDFFASFCPVCMYVLINMINPAQHWLLDSWHDENIIIYP